MLFINNLKIKNFKNIEDIDLNFSKINLISGEAGNGKTAIQQSLILMLCNYIEGKLEDYINWQNNSKEFLLNMNFSYMSNKYNYEIKCGKSTDRILKIGNEEYFKSDAYKYISDNILDPVLTLYSNISEQGKTASLLFETPAKGLEIIKKIFKLDSLNEKVEEMKVEIKENKNRIDILEAEKNILESREFEFVDIPELPKVNIDELNKKKVQLEKDKEIYNKELEQHTKYKEKLSQYNEYQEKLEVLKEELKKIVNEKNQFDLNSISVDYDKIKELNNFIIEKDKEIVKLDYDLQNYEKSIKLVETLDNKILKIEKEISDIDIKRIERCKYSEKDIENIDDEIISCKEKINKLRNQLKLVEEGKCFNCGTVFESSEEEKDDIKKVIEDTDNLLKRRLSEKEEVKKRIKEYEIKLNELNNNIDKKKSYESQLQELRKEKEEIVIKEIDKNVIDKLKEEIKIKKELHNSLEENRKEYENIKNKVDELNQKEKSVEEKIEIYNIEKPEEFKFSIEFNEKEYNILIEDIQKYNYAVRERENFIKQNEKIKEEKKKVEKEIDSKNEEIHKKSRRNQILNESQKILNKDFSSYVINMRTSYINQKMNEFFQRAYQGRYRIKFEQDKKGIGFYYSKDGEDWHSTVTLSGFERQLFSIGFRLALTTLQDSKILLLDEVDSDASTEKSLMLYKNLLSESNIDQFFIISHNEETKEYIRNQIGCSEFSIENGKLI